MKYIVFILGVFVVLSFSKDYKAYEVGSVIFNPSSVFNSYSVDVYCINGVSYMKYCSINTYGLTIMLDKDSKIIPCKVDK